VRTFTVYRGWDRTEAAKVGEFSSTTKAFEAARRMAAGDTETYTVRDILGGLRGEFKMVDEGVRSQITPTG
jgi:predicted ATPase